MSDQRTEVRVGFLYAWMMRPRIERARGADDPSALGVCATLAILLSALLSGCASNSERIDTLARAGSLQKSVIEVEGFRSVVYRKDDAPEDDTVLVFLEGDGRPWIAGVSPSVDPTTGNPLALELLMQTPRRGVYVARPCYQQVASERCTPAMWTSARYSEQVVHVLAETIRSALQDLNADRIILIGHSGGGVLAVLVAERMPNVAGVVTIAANLDIDAWTSHHGYLPLSESLNPARSAHPHPWREVHIAGRHDRVVPLETTSSYFDRYPESQRWPFDEHGHVCCWKDAWPQLWKRIESVMKSDE